MMGLRLCSTAFLYQGLIKNAKLVEFILDHFLIFFLLGAGGRREGFEPGLVLCPNP
jgi:hypothetical protein